MSDPESESDAELLAALSHDVDSFEAFYRTATNMALLSPPVPEGYTQVDELTPCS